MANTPFFKIQLQSGFDFSEFVTQMRYEDCTEKVNLLTVKLYDLPLRLLEDKRFEEGAVVEYMFGWLGGNSSGKHVGKLVDVQPDYSADLVVTLQITDMGLDMKKGENARIFENKTASQIAAQLAAEHGLDADIEPTSFKYEMMAQGNMSDYELLQKLALQEENGHYIFYTKGNKLVFKKIALDKPSDYTFTWTQLGKGSNATALAGGSSGEGTLLTFRPSSNAVLKQAQSKSTQVLSEGLEMGKTQVAEVSEEKAPNDTQLGKKRMSFNENGELVKGKQRSPAADKKISGQHVTQTAEEKSGKKLVYPTPDYKIAENMAAKLRKQSALKDMTAQLTAGGMPSLQADSIVTMAGVARQHMGNWYIAQVNHDITPGQSYQVTLTLWKDAGRGAEEKQEAAPIAQAKVNDTVGSTTPAAAKKPVKVRKFNANAEEL